MRWLMPSRPASTAAEMTATISGVSSVMAESTAAERMASISGVMPGLPAAAGAAAGAATGAAVLALALF